MFDTTVNHWFQSFDHEKINWVLNIVSLIGFVPFLLLIVLVILAGVNFRYGIIIINFLGWTVLVTLLLKEAIEHPRPIEVDNTLKNLLFLSEDLVNQIRSQGYGTSGFPSGHVAFQTSIWIGAALLIRKQWLWITGIIIILLTMISRLYLAHHYLGDVLAGLIIGLVVTVLLYEIILKLKMLEVSQIKRNQLIFFLSPVVLIFFLPYIPIVQLGRFLGLNFGFLAILYFWQFPQLKASLSSRILKVILFVFIYFLFFMIYLNIPKPEAGFSLLLLNIAVNLSPIVISAYYSKKLKLISL